MEGMNTLWRRRACLTAGALRCSPHRDGPQAMVPSCTGQDCTGDERVQASRHGITISARSAPMHTVPALSLTSQPRTAFPLPLPYPVLLSPQQNLGAVVRSAYCLGAAGVLACARNCAPLSPVVSKVGGRVTGQG